MEHRHHHHHTVLTFIPALGAIALLLSAACGGTEAGNPDAGTPDAGEAADAGNLDGGGTLASSNQGLTDFVASGGYLTGDWTAEPAVHPDRGGPHGMVRIYFNDLLYQSLKAGNAVHPRGSMVLKETYSADGQTLRGHMIDMKDVGDDGEDQWVWWYRPGSTSGLASTYFRGTNNYCASCHATGSDYVRAPAP